MTYNTIRMPYNDPCYAPVLPRYNSHAIQLLVLVLRAHVQPTQELGRRFTSACVVISKVQHVGHAVGCRGSRAAHPLARNCELPPRSKLGKSAVFVLACCVPAPPRTRRHHPDPPPTTRCRRPSRLLCGGVVLTWARRLIVQVISQSHPFTCRRVNGRPRVSWRREAAHFDRTIG